MDPVRNPYAPGAGQRPPELAGRDGDIRQFDVTLERVAQGRPERSLILSGLRGVGKTVLLNALRGRAVNRAWGTGKLEARLDQGLRLPLAQAVHVAVRDLGQRHRDPARVERVTAVLKAFALRTTQSDRQGSRWTPPMDVAAAKGRADSGDLELDLVELFTDVAELAADLGVGAALFIDEMQDLSSADLSAAVRGRSRDQPAGCAAGDRRRRVSRTCRWPSPRRSPTQSGCSTTGSSTGCHASRPIGRCSSPRPPNTSGTTSPRWPSCTG